MRGFSLLAALILASVALLGQGGRIPVQRGLTIEYTGAPASLDLVSMFGNYNHPDVQWASARSYIHTVKFYHGQLFPNPTPAILNIIGGNTLERLSLSGALRNIRRDLQMGMAIEIGAMKPENCLSTLEDIRRSINELLPTFPSVYQADGHITRLDIDNSIGHCGSSVDASAAVNSRWSMLLDDELRKLLPTIKKDYPVVHPRLALIEAYPNTNIEGHLTYLRKINSERRKYGYDPIAAYFLDIDHNAVASDTKLRDEVTWFAVMARLEGVKVGVILNGDDEDKKNPWTNKDLDYLRTVAKRLERFQRLGILSAVDIVAVQSWAAEANGMQSVPRNAPESGITQTNLLLHALLCMAGRVACLPYP